jgi:hypothetical protein
VVFSFTCSDFGTRFVSFPLVIHLSLTAFYMTWIPYGILRYTTNDPHLVGYTLTYEVAMHEHSGPSKSLSQLCGSRIQAYSKFYWGADKSLPRPTSRCILFDGENISFDASLVIYINSTNIPPIMIINRIYETQNLLSL